MWLDLFKDIIFIIFLPQWKEWLLCFGVIITVLYLNGKDSTRD